MKTLTPQMVRDINEAMGEAAFRQLATLPKETLRAFALALEEGRVALHSDGMMGFTVDTEDGWTSEGFKA